MIYGLYNVQPLLCIIAYAGAAVIGLPVLVHILFSIARARRRR